MSTKMIDAYVYKITNKVTKEYYYGYRYKNQTLRVSPEKDLWITYFTSSNRIKSDIQKYGKNAFTADIIFRNIDSIECWKKEQSLIKEAWGDQMLLNGKYHDIDSTVEVYRRVGITSDKARKKMSAAGKGKTKSESHRKNISIANTGKKGSLEKSRKISIARLGKAPSNKGKSPPKDTCVHCGKLASVANLKKWHGDRCKQVDPYGHIHRTKAISSLHLIRKEKN